MDMLRTADLKELVKQIQADIAAVGVAGEESMSLLIYLVGTSRLLDHPLAAVVQGPSAAGKSYVIATVSKLFPKDCVVQAHRITPQALVDVPAGELVNTFVVGGERSRRRDPEATRTLRELLADGHTSVLRPKRKTDSTGRKDVKGPIAFIESTTLEPDEIFGEDLNRCLLVHVDASAAQTKRVLIHMAERAKSPNSTDVTPITAKHHAAQKLLKKCNVFVPYAETLAKLYPYETVEARRSFPLLLSLIRTIRLLRQYQQSMEPEDGMPLAADLDDYELARYLLARPKNSGLTGKIAETYQMLPKLRPRFSTGDVATAMKRDYGDTSVAIRALKTLGLIQALVPAKGRRAARYELVQPNDDGLDLPARELLVRKMEIDQAGTSFEKGYLYARVIWENLARDRGYDIIVPSHGANAPTATRPEKPGERAAEKPAGEDVTRSFARPPEVADTA